MLFLSLLFFFFNDTATTEIYTLSLHDALPISLVLRFRRISQRAARVGFRARKEGAGAATAATDRSKRQGEGARRQDRKSTRLNSSHGYISYAVFCLKKKNNTQSHKNNNIHTTI